MTTLIENEIPVISASGNTLPEAWEDSLIWLWNRGQKIKTQYDKPDSPESIDATMIITVHNPFMEPMIHRNFPAGLENLEIYRQEVVEGVHNYWMNKDDKAWRYTYNDRLFGYPAFDPGLFSGVYGINQIEHIINDLINCYYTRRAQAITWYPPKDAIIDDCPCLQRIWFRMLYNEVEDRYYLNMNTHWRSRDAYKAAFMNMYAMIHLMTYIAMEIEKKINKPVYLSRYVDISDSYHIYGDYYSEVEAFIKRIDSDEPISERTWNSDDPIVKASFDIGREILQHEKETGEIGKY